MISAKKLFGKVRTKGRIPYWPDGTPLDGVDITHWACWRARVERVVPKPGEPGFQRHLRLEQA